MVKTNFKSRVPIFSLLIFSTFLFFSCSNLLNKNQSGSFSVSLPKIINTKEVSQENNFDFVLTVKSLDSQNENASKTFYAKSGETLTILELQFGFYHIECFDVNKIYFGALDVEIASENQNVILTLKKLQKGDEEIPPTQEETPPKEDVDNPPKEEENPPKDDENPPKDDEPSQQIEIGFICYEDNSFSAEYDSSKTPIGILFELPSENNGNVYKIMSLEQNDSSIFRREPTGALEITLDLTNDDDGYENYLEYKNQISEKADQMGETEFLVFNYAESIKTVNLSWYVPAKNELLSLYNNKSKINNSIQKIIDGKGNATPLDEQKYYWTSNTSTEKNISYVSVGNFGAIVETFFFDYPDKYKYSDSAATVCITKIKKN